MHTTCITCFMKDSVEILVEVSVLPMSSHPYFLVYDLGTVISVYSHIPNSIY